MAVSLDSYHRPMTALTVYNLPFSAGESDVHSIFPSAQSVQILRNQPDSTQYRGACILQFSNARECQRVYEECQHGKEVEGHLLEVKLCEGDLCGYSPQKYGGYQEPHTQVVGNRHAPTGDHGCVLMVSNIPYAATEDDIRREFRDAVGIELCLNEQGRFKGVAQITFASAECCSAALQASYTKTLFGRPMRGRILGAESDSNRDSSNRREFDNDRRGYGGNQRDFNDRRDSGGQRYQRDFGNRRDFGGNRNFDSRGGRGEYNNRRGRSDAYNSYDRDGGRFQHGSRGGGRDMARYDGGGRSDQNKRERSPVRGYGSNKGGPRITSAVITRPDAASASSSDAD